MGPVDETFCFLLKLTSRRLCSNSHGTDPSVRKFVRWLTEGYAVSV